MGGYADQRLKRGVYSPSYKAPVNAGQANMDEFISQLKAPARTSKLASVVTKNQTVKAPAYMMAGKNPPLPQLLTRDGASAVANKYNQDALRMSVDSPSNRGVGYNTALGGYNPEAMDNMYNGAYDAQAGVPQYNADGMNVNNAYQPNAPVQAQQLPDLNTLQQTQQPSSVGSWFNGSMSTPNGMPKADFQALPIEQQAKLMSGKTGWETLGSTMSGVGTMAGGLAGVYGAYANAKYQKDQTKMQKAMIRGDEANKSAFAKAAGGTYQSSGV